MPKEKSAGAIIYRKESLEPAQGKNNNNIYYLLLHYAPPESGRRGHWGFAKGHVEKDESEEETARREVAEETGIKNLKIILGFKTTAKYFFRKVYGLKGEARKKAPWVFKSVVYFVAEAVTKEVKISPEHVGFLWLPFDQAVKRVTFKNSKELLKKADDFIREKKA